MGIENITNANLANFWGSDQLYFNPMYREYKYTQGIKFISDNGAAWMITDILAIVKFHGKVSKEEFVNITLKVKDGKGTMIYDNGNGKVLYRQKYDCVDFPLPKFNLYCEYKTLMLPSER